MSLCQGYKCSDDKNIGTVRLRNYSKINHENTKVRKHEIRHKNALSRLRADLENFEHRFSQIYTDNIIVHKFKNLCSSVFICVHLCPKVEIPIPSSYGKSATSRLKPLFRFLIYNTAYRANKIITKAFTALAHPTDPTSRIPYHQGMVRNVSCNCGSGP